MDPVEQSDKEPSASPYAYVNDRATNYRDPSGACSSNPDHNAAVGLALVQLYALYSQFNVYGDCPPEAQSLHGVSGLMKLTTTVPPSQPDIVVSTPGFTYLYEVKPASDQLSSIKPGLLPRQANIFSQFLRYLNALRAANFPNVQPGPDIVPASMPYEGGTLTIFSGADWSKYAGSRRPAEYDNPGLIFYIKTRPPRRRSPNKPPLMPGVKVDQNNKQTPKQNPASTPTQDPTDSGAVTQDWAGNLITLGVGLAVAAVVVALLPEEIVGGLLLGAADLIVGDSAVATAADAVVSGAEAVGSGLASAADTVGSFLGL